jgi:MATE family multidrug resistance protein
MRARGRFPSKTGLTRQLALLATPLIFQQVSYTLLGVADTFFVSRISTTALAAVGLAGVLFFAILMLFRGIANSTVVFVGRAHGAGDNEAIGRWVWRCLSLIGLLSLLAIGLPWLFEALFALSAPPDNPEVRDLGTAYLRIRAIEAPMAMFSGVVWGFLVGRGDSRTPMLLAWMTVGLNIVLDWVLVLGNLGAPQLGVVGAAWATVIANFVNAVVSGAILWSPSARKRYGTGRAFLPSWGEIARVARVGVPMGFGDFIEIASFSAFFALIGRLGTDALAANQIALQYMSLSFTVGIAFGMATSSLVSRELGAGNPDRAEGVGYRGVGLGSLAMGLIGLSYLIAPGALMGVFSDDPEVIHAGVLILQLVALYQVFDAAAIVLAGALNGAGDTTFTMVARAVMGWGVFIPLVALIVLQWGGGVRESWIGALIYLGGLGAIYLIRFRSGRWKGLMATGEGVG